jgi:predicted transposase YbfD/YdcC
LHRGAGRAAAVRAASVTGWRKSASWRHWRGFAAKAEGDYIWLIKDNQPQLRADIEQWFAPETHVKGLSSAAKDFQTACTVSKGHGRHEERTLTTSSLLNGYLAWRLAQVFKLERRVVSTAAGQVRHETVYGISSLTVQKADAKRLNGLIRQYWGIENGLHYQRDRSLRVDATRIHNRNQAKTWRHSTT